MNLLTFLRIRNSITIIIDIF